MRRPRRKAIPQATQITILVRQSGVCAACGNALDGSVEFDHRPALISRQVNEDKTDYEPPQLDIDFIEAVHADCHQQRTTGRKAGAERTVTTKGSDIWLKKKFARLEKPPRRKHKIRSRPFPNKANRKAVNKLLH